eukprot:115804_1
MKSLNTLISIFVFFIWCSTGEQEQRLKGTPVVAFCNKTSTPLIVNSYSVKPDDIKANEDVTLQLFATLTEVVTSGTIEIEAKVGFIPVYNHKLDLCTEAQAGGMKCPLQATNYNITQTVQIPNTKLHGHIKANIQITDQKNAQLACMSVEVRV